jgi:hypothetical protein
LISLEKLLPASPDIQEILERIREKYDLPKIELGDDPLETCRLEALDHKNIC